MKAWKDETISPLPQGSNYPARTRPRISISCFLPSFLSFFVYVCIYLCTHVCLPMHVCMPCVGRCLQTPEEDIRSPEARVPGHWEQPQTGARNKTSGLWKSSQESTAELSLQPGHVSLLSLSQEFPHKLPMECVAFGKGYTLIQLWKLKKNWLERKLWHICNLSIQEAETEGLSWVQW